MLWLLLIRAFSYNALAPPYTSLIFVIDDKQNSCPKDHNVCLQPHCYSNRSPQDTSEVGHHEPRFSCVSQCSTTPKTEYTHHSPAGHCPGTAQTLSGQAGGLPSSDSTQGYKGLSCTWSQETSVPHAAPVPANGVPQVRAPLQPPVSPSPTSLLPPSPLSPSASPPALHNFPFSVSPFLFLLSIWCVPISAWRRSYP